MLRLRFWILLAVAAIVSFSQPFGAAAQPCASYPVPSTISWINADVANIKYIVQNAVSGPNLGLTGLVTLKPMTINGEQVAANTLILYPGWTDLSAPPNFVGRPALPGFPNAGLKPLLLSAGTALHRQLATLLGQSDGFIGFSVRYYEPTVSYGFGSATFNISFFGTRAIPQHDGTCHGSRWRAAIEDAMKKVLDAAGIQSIPQTAPAVPGR